MDMRKEIISRLKFIGCIKKDEKISTSSNVAIQPDNFMTKILRFFYKDNRENTLKFIITTIDKSFEILGDISKLTKDHDSSRREQNITMYRQIIDDIRQAQIGISNLRHTYLKYDIKFCCDLDTLNAEIESKLKDYTLETIEQQKGSFSPQETYAFKPIGSPKTEIVRVSEPVEEIKTVKKKH